MTLPVQAAYTHNGQSIPADAFYAIACDPRRSVAVEACAGAGKTWMLVSRMVRALLAGMTAQGQVQPQEILAITFTKKAAGEMRERLYGWLEEFAQADDETLLNELTKRGVDIKNTSKNGLESNKYGREQLSNLYRNVLASGRPVQIRTFHSWFAALLSSAPIAALQQLGLPTNYELLEDIAPARPLLWRRFYTALLALPELKADFEAVVLACGRSQTDKALQGALTKRSEFLLADSAGVAAASVQHFTGPFPEFTGLAHPGDSLQPGHSHRTLFYEAAKVLGAASAPSHSAKGTELEMALTAGQIDGALAALLTEKGTPRKFGEKIIGIAVVRLAQDAALRLLDACTQVDAWAHQQRMTRLTRLLLQEFAALKFDRGWVDMDDVERAASLMLRDPVLSSWVQERLDARVKHLMIDEFQDTNPQQWQALSSWLESYAGAGGAAPSVFLVGDPKQSIYRFRRAEPQVFIAAQAFVRDALQGDVLACDHTRRSSRAVVHAVNVVMENAREMDGYEGFRPHTSASTQAGGVLRFESIARNASGPATAVDTPGEVPWRDSLTTPRELVEDTLHTHQARRVAAWIEIQLQAPLEVMGKPLQAKNIMVLARRRAGLLPLQAELRALNIPAQIGEKTPLIECCEVLDVVALLDVLVSPQHDMSMARALRSPLFNLGDDALVELALAQDQTNRSWFSMLLNNELLAPAFIGLGAKLAQYQSWVNSLPPHDALQAIYDAGDVLARFAAAAPTTARPSVLANLRALLHAALSEGGGRFATPYAFVRALKAGSLQAPSAVNVDAVRLLTVHGAKGLEADTVILLDTDAPERSKESMGVLIDWPAEAAAPAKFVFLLSESKPPACAKALLTVELAARQREELNALYVAMTRACSTLVLAAIAPHRPAPRSWWQRLHALATEVSVLQDNAVPSVTSNQPAHFTLLELPELPPSLRADTANALLNADSLSARIGKAMHRLLEWGDVDSAELLQRAARQFELDAAQIEAAQAMARRIRRGEAAWAWNDAVVLWQGNEVELLIDGQLRRIDRLVQRKDAGHAGHWWVLDYKSSQQPECQPELLAQLHSYRTAVQLIYPGAVVKAAFLTSPGGVVELAEVVDAVGGNQTI